MSAHSDEKVSVRIVPATPAPPAQGRLGRRVRTAMLVAALTLTPACTAVPGSGGTMEITAYFEDSAGLFVGNDVGILGVEVGEVKEIEPIGDRVRVTLEIDDEHKVPANAGAVVVARSVATDRYIELTPVYAKGPTMEDGDEIGMKRTRTPVDFDQVLASLNEFATGIAGSKKTTRAIARFIDAGTNALEGNGPLLNQTIHALQKGVDGIAAQRDNIAGTIRSLDVLLAAVATNEATARTFIQQVAKASDLLARERENFRTALRSLDDAVTVVAEFAVENRAEIVDSLDGSTRVMKTLLRKQNQLTQILRVMPLALQNIERATDGDRLPVVFDPVALDPLGGVLRDICDRLPRNLCDLLGTDPLREGGTR